MTRYVNVTMRVAFDVDDCEKDDNLQFRIEENGCPGTGMVGAAIEKAIRESNARGVCWACPMHGRNELVPR